MTTQLYEIETDAAGRTGMALRFHPGQRRAWESTARFISMTAGSQAGKTCFQPHWALREIQRTRQGGGVVTATFPLMREKLLPEFKGLFHGRLGWHYQGGDVPTRGASFTRGDGLRFTLSSAGQPQESGTWGWGICDECGLPEFKRGTHDGIIRRLQLASGLPLVPLDPTDPSSPLAPQGRILYGTTPYRWGEWHQTEVVARAEGGDTLYENVNFRSPDNPAYPMTEYERLMREWPSWKSEMFLHGRYTRPAGAIFSDFDETVHVVAPFSIPPMWRRCVGIDFGPVNTAVTWLAEDPDTRLLQPDGSLGGGNWYAYRCSHGGGLDSPQHARAARDFRERVNRWVGGGPSEDGDREEWMRAAGLLVEAPPIPEIEVQISSVVKWFRLRMLYVFETLYELRRELKGYARVLDEAGNATDAIADDPKFHRVASVRYGVSSLDHKPLVDSLPRWAQPADTGEPSYPGVTQGGYET